MPDLINLEVSTSKIGDNAITLQKIQTLTDKRLIGRIAGQNGDAQQIELSDDFTQDTFNAKLWMNNYDRFRSKVEYFEDCFAASIDGNGSSFLAQNVSGTNAVVSNVTVLEDDIFGVWACETGTTSSGRAALFSGRSSNGAAFLLGQGTTKVKTKIKLPTLSTSGDRYKILFGLVGDCTSSAVTDGVYFDYTEGSSNNWRMCTSNDSTRTETPSSVVVTNNQWIRLEIIINSSATVASYVLNGSTIGTVSTNIPSDVGDAVSPILGIYKSAGSSNRTIQTDYVALSVELNSTRAT
jgi:uncharacterized protein with putative carbohydrate binding module